MDKVIERKGLGKKQRMVLLSLTGAVALALFVFFAFSGPRSLRVKTERLTISTVLEAPFQEFIPVTGTVQPIKTVMIDAIEGGTVQEIFAEDGQVVEAGEPILRLSNPSLQMDAINREAQLLDQQNNLRTTRISMDQKTIGLRQELLQLDRDLAQATRTYQQNLELVEGKLISGNEMAKSREDFEFLSKRRELLLRNLKSDSVFRATQVGQIESSLELIRRNLEFLQSNLQSLVVKAPIAGQLSALRADLGQTKAPGENIGQVDQTHDFRIEARVGEHYLSRVSIGQRAEFTLAGKVYPVVISKIFPEVSNGEFQVDLAFEKEKPQDIRRGQSLQIRLELSDETSAMLVPRGGFYQSTGGHWAYVLTEDGRAVKREITLGRQNPDYYEVRSGLEAGERVITNRYEGFNDAEVLILE